MYVAKLNQHPFDDEVKNFVRTNAFGVLVSNGSGKICGTHIPLELSEDATRLEGHIARANPQWKNFSDADEVLAIFTGPHAYVSSSWYDHENVPTWNYIAVHIYGKIRVIDGEELINSLKKLVDKYENGRPNQVAVERMSKPFLTSHIHALVGFAIDITEVQVAYKLSQNRDDKNHRAIVDHLEKGGDENSTRVAEAMKSTRPYKIPQP